MQLKTLLTLPHFHRFSHSSLHFPRPPTPSNFPLSSQTTSPQNRCFKLSLTACAGNINHLEISRENTSNSESVALLNDDDVEAGCNGGALADHSIWAQMKEIVILVGLPLGSGSGAVHESHLHGHRWSTKFY